jgi:RNA polymerase sigma-32 factor
MRDAGVTSRGAAIYLAGIRRFPILQAEEEHALAVRWRDHADQAAAHQLLTSHLRLVAKIAAGYRRCGMPAADVISEGNIGLMEALKRFDPDKGVRFSTYAMWWIKAYIQSYVLRSWSLVRMGTNADQKKLFFNLSKAKRRLAALGEGDLRSDQVAAIAEELGVASKEVVEMNRRLNGDLSLNVAVNEEGGSDEWQDRLVDETSDHASHVADNQESDSRREALRQALTALDSRERQIFEARRLADPPHKLEELATRFSVSRERVRQIEKRAFQKVRNVMHVASARKPSSIDRLPTKPPSRQPLRNRRSLDAMAMQRAC